MLRSAAILATRWWTWFQLWFRRLYAAIVFSMFRLFGRTNGHILSASASTDMHIVDCTDDIRAALYLHHKPTLDEVWRYLHQRRGIRAKVLTLLIIDRTRAIRRSVINLDTGRETTLHVDVSEISHTGTPGTVLCTA